MTQVLKQNVPLLAVEREIEVTDRLEQMFRSICSRTEGQQVIIMSVGIVSPGEGSYERDMVEVQMMTGWTQDYPLRRGLAHAVQHAVQGLRDRG